MIYDFPTADADIRQGDIFFGVPRFEFSLDSVLLLGETDEEETTWEAATGGQDKAVVIGVAARPVMGIVITQDCDTIRADQIALCEIKPLGSVVPSLGTNLQKWVENVRKQSKYNLKWFYLPPDAGVGFTEKMAVDFQVTMTIPRADLEARRSARKGRLNAEADEHFREKLSEFFRRYPVDEWYPFTREEFEVYKQKAQDAKPRPWQV